MNLTLTRTIHSATSTIGKLSINGEFECYTLEDVVREVEGEPVAKWKIPGKTAIPRGKYKVIINFSNRFQKHMPLLLDVPGFEGIRIHPGNTDKDTEGCLLPGTKHKDDMVLESRKAYNALLAKIQAARGKGEEIWISVG